MYEFSSAEEVITFCFADFSVYDPIPIKSLVLEKFNPIFLPCCLSAMHVDLHIHVTHLMMTILVSTSISCIVAMLLPNTATTVIG